MQRFVLIAALAACGGKDERPKPKPDKVETHVPPEPAAPTTPSGNIDKPVRRVRPLETK
jgi:hypothetical protein